MSAPVVTPSSLVVEKEQVVVIEFRREIPKNSFLTLDVYYEGSNSKFATLPTALLGTRTVRAMFPVFPKPGVVNVSILLARDEDTRFPQFKIKVQSAIESLASSLPTTKGSKQVALLAAAVAYLANSDENDREAVSNADEVISDILKGLQPADLPDWTLAWLLCGKFSPAENLLHVCTRQSLTQSLDVLLQPWFIEDRAHHLLQKAPDNKTPVDIARKLNLGAVSEAAEHLVANGTMKLATPKSKKKFNITRASSIDSNLQHLVQDSPTSPVKKNKGKKAKRMIRQLFRSETKDKFSTPSPQHPTMDELQRRQSNFGGSSESLSSITLPRNHRHSVLSTGTDSSGTPSESTAYSTAGKDEAFYEQRRMSQTLPRMDQTHASPKPTDRERRPPQPLPSPGQDRLQVTETRARPVSSLSSGYGSAVSNAVAELKEKAIYKAEVVRQYKWESSNCNDVVLQVGDKVYVTQEVEDNMCLGVCNDRYCRFPKSIICILSNCGVDDDIEDEHDYSRIVLPGASDDEDDDEDIYKVPRNVPRVASSDSDSDDSDHIYDIPPNKEDILSHLIAEGHYMRVPTRNSILESVLSGLALDSSSKTPQQGQASREITAPSTSDCGQDMGASNQPQGEQADDTGNDENDDGIYDVPSSVLRSIDDPIGQVPQPTAPAVEHTSSLSPRAQTTAITATDAAPELKEDEENDDGIYDVPSSVLRTAPDTAGQDESTSQEYDTLIPLATRGPAKIADENQKVMPNTPGWGYAEIKDSVPFRGVASHQPGHAPIGTSTTASHVIHYAEIDDITPSKGAAPFVQKTHEQVGAPLKSTRDDSDDIIAIHTHGSETRAQDWSKSKRSSSEPHVHVTHASVLGSRNDALRYIEDSEEDGDSSGIYDVPSSIIRSIDEDTIATTAESPKDISLTRRETERSSESSETEERRNTGTPEGSEGSDVFVDLPLTTAAKGKANSLPSSSHRSVLGVGVGHPMSSQSAMAAGARTVRTRIASEPQVSPKPRPAKRTKITQPSLHPYALDETPPSPKLPPRDSLPPPPLPQKPPPVMPDKPPALPEKPPASLPPKPPAPLPDMPPPALPEKSPPLVREKPPAPLPTDPPFEVHLGDKSPPFGRSMPPPQVAGKPSEYLSSHHKTVVDAPLHGKRSPTLSEGAPKPKPRRNIPPTKRVEGNNSLSQAEVRTTRSHTTADCTASLDQPERLVRPSRIKSSSDAQSHSTGNSSVVNGQHTQGGNTAHSHATFLKGRAAAPPVARKPKQVSPNSSPVPGLTGREQFKPLTSPKPRRR